MQSGIYLKGLDELERQMNKIIKEVNKEKTQVLAKGAKKIAKEIRARAPVGPTGNLKKAVYSKAYPETTTSNAVAFAGIRPRKAPHAYLVEYGHGGPHPAPPHPFVRPAIDTTLPEVRRDIEKALGKTIKGVF